MKRSVKRLLIFLLLGVVVNVALSWGKLAHDQYFDLSPKRASMPTVRWSDAITTEERRLWSSRRPPGFMAEPTMATHLGRWGYERILLSADGSVLVKGSKRWESGFVTRAGWPMRCFEGEWWSQTEGVRTTTFEKRERLWKVASRTNPPRELTLPTRVMPMGFAVNSLMFATLLWLIFSAPFDYRRWKRIKRSCCSTCGYPVGTSAVCTECGGFVKGTKHKAQSTKNKAQS